VERISVDGDFRNRFEPLESLGAGAVGLVYRGRDHATGRTVAIKFLTRTGDPSLLLRFVQEGRILARLRHPNLVQVIEMDVSASVPYLVTEFVAGGTLRGRMTPDVCMNQTQVLDYIYGILDGIAECHAHGIIHRDLKPENILISEEGVAKVADLGIAKDYARSGPVLTQSVALVGTPRYMSPEQLRLEPVAISSDLYAVGLILYELLAGEHYLHGNTLPDLLRNSQQLDKNRLQRRSPLVSDSLARAVHWALEPSMGRRPASATDLIQALKASVATPGRQTGSPRRSSAWLGIAIVAIVLLATAQALRPWVENRHARICLERGQALLESGDRTGAEALARGALTRHPTDAQLLLFHGLTLSVADRFAEAEIEFREALRQAPGHQEIRVHLIRALVILGKDVEAEGLIRLALHESPEDSQQWVQLGVRSTT